MKFGTRFVVSMLVITAVVSVIALVIIRTAVRGSALEQAKNGTAELIRSKAQAGLSASDFMSSDSYSRQKTFQAFMNDIRTRDIIKIKAINSRLNIIYSTNEADIGKKTDSINYRNAMLDGSVIALIQPPANEASNADISRHQQLMEIYVPITYGEMRAGVIEVYFSMDAVNRNIMGISKTVLGLIFALSLVTTGLVYGRQVIRASKPLEAGDGRA